MPKRGRRDESVSNPIEYQSPRGLGIVPNVVTKNAPFGTFDTPVQKPRIIGGKLVFSHEDGHYGIPRWAQPDSAKAYNSPRRGGSRNSHPSTPLRQVGLLSDNPTRFNPHAFAKQGHEKNFYSSAHQDIHLSSRHNTPSHDMNPHTVLPPIGTPTQPTYIQPTYTSPVHQPTRTEDNEVWHRVEYNINPPVRSELYTRYLPPDGSILPTVPITMSKTEELELRQLIRQDLISFDAHKLRNVYIELTGFDKDLDGSITYENLVMALLRAKVCISTENLRLISSLFISLGEGNKHYGLGSTMINYEKVLSFIAAAQQADAPLVADLRAPPSVHGQYDSHRSPQRTPQTRYHSPPEYDRNDVPPDGPPKGSPVPSTTRTSTPDPDDLVIPLTTMENKYPGCKHQTNTNPIIEDHSPRSKTFPYGDRDNAKLLKLIECALMDSGDELNYDHIYNVFRKSDRAHRGMLSRTRIQALAEESRIPLQASLVNQIINKLDCSNGQYSWTQFIEFLERVQPTSTGLNIPASKQPHEYVKHYQEPSADWPNNNATPKLDESRGNNVQSRNDHKHMNGDHRSMNDSHHASNYQPPSDKSDDRPGRVASIKSITNVESDIQRLEAAKHQLLSEEKRRKEGEEPWFQRYMKLAKALYDNDIDANGYLPRDEVLRLSNFYNDTHDLNIADQAITHCIQDSIEGGDNVALDTYLKHLSLQNR